MVRVGMVRYTCTRNIMPCQLMGEELIPIHYGGDGRNMIVSNNSVMIS